MNRKFISLAIAAASVLALSAPALAIDPIVIHLGDVEQESSVTTPDKVTTTGSIGTHPGAGGVGSPLCDPMPTAYEAYYSLCGARLFPVSQSERSTGVAITKGGTTYSCTTTSYYSTSTYDGSGSIFNPGNWDTTYSSTEATAGGAC